jgi:membrane-associated phospholipid phosphatase
LPESQPFRRLFYSEAPDVRSSEWIAIVYFAAMTALGWVRPLVPARRLQITATGLAMCGAILWVSRDGSVRVRDWASVGYILAGYYMSGRFFVRPSPAIERWLMSWDRRLLGDPTTRFARWPAPLLGYLEVVYMGCVLLVPAGFAWLAASGRAALADRYWTMVGAAEFGAFLPLAVMQTRPPWAVERPATLRDRAVHHFAARMVRELTINANTFPSGHVAGSFAVAFALLGPMPWAGGVCLLLAISISVACVVGRYHYVVDGVAGVALALAIYGVVTAAGL